MPVSHEDKHLRAQRFARVRVAEIQLYHAAAMKSGRAAGDVYTALKAQMDAAREAYRERFLNADERNRRLPAYGICANVG